MADITKCDGIAVVNNEEISCPRRHRCYRFTAESSPWQSVFVELMLNHDRTSCDYFWDNGELEAKGTE